MKLAAYVAEFLAKQSIRHVFGITGGASLHLIHAVADRPDLRMICPHHEQAAAMAADSYARVTGNLGAAIATSGPGATNLITGICCAYYDSIPVLYLTGQVATFRAKGDTGVRQMGFQETNTLDICRSITKYAAAVSDPRRIRYELEKAVFMARTGRPGPVLLDIPDDVQRAEIDPMLLERFVPQTADHSDDAWVGVLDACITAMRGAQRPVVVVGWGVRLAGAERELFSVLERLQFPVLPTWATADLFDRDHPLLVGTFGTHGTRHGNFTVQNSDLLLAIGTRLDTHETGSPPGSFARGARKIVVDIDAAELRKFSLNGMHVEYPVCADAKEFLLTLSKRLEGIVMPDNAMWKKQIASWRNQYRPLRPEYRAEKTVNPYVFVDSLSDATATGDIIVSDTGCAVAWMMQSFRFKPSQRFFHAFNNTPMGYALPASIGAALASQGQRVICIAGDGSLQMNVQELATLSHHRPDVKIFVMDNHGYSMIQQTQDQWLDSRYIGSSKEGGTSMPDFCRLAEAYGVPAVSIRQNSDIARVVREVLSANGPVLCDVDIPSTHRVIPQVKFGRPIEDPEPLLEREEFMRNMIVEALPVSCKSQ
jgi:acetolactate synthase-1/2/3 large subunit